MNSARVLALVLGSTVLACAHVASREERSNRSPSSPFVVAVEGPCPKLRVHDAGPAPVLVYGTYGIEESSEWSGRPSVRASQSLAIIRDGTVRTEPRLVEGLPRTSLGWVEGDLELRGDVGGGLSLDRIERAPAPPESGALFDTVRTSHGWNGSSWSLGESGIRGEPLAELPAMALCSTSFVLLAHHRLGDGTAWVAGRCEDGAHRPQGPLVLASHRADARRWTHVEVPSTQLFEGSQGNVNVRIEGSRDDLFVYAYRPFARPDEELPWAWRWGGSKLEAVPMPSGRSVVAMTRAKDGSLWAVLGFEELHRRDVDGRWQRIDLPPPRFVDGVTSSVRLLDVQAVRDDVWVHVAVSIVREDGAAGRSHVLFTTSPWKAPVFCDHERSASSALGEPPRRFGAR